MSETLKKRVQEYEKKNGETGYRLTIQPTKITTDDYFTGVVLVEPQEKKIPAGTSASGKTYDAFSVFSVFMAQEDGEAISVSIPQGTFLDLKNEASIVGKQVTFKKKEKNFGTEEKPNYRTVLGATIENRSNTKEVSSETDTQANSTNTTNEGNQVSQVSQVGQVTTQAIDETKKKVLDYYKSSGAKPNDVVKVGGVETTYALYLKELI